MTPLAPAVAARRKVAGPGPRVWTGVLSVLVVLALWQLLGSTGAIDPRYFGTPTSVLDAGGTLLSSGELGQAAQVSLLEFFGGLLLAIVVGVPLGMLMGWRVRVRQTLEPTLLALYLTPSLALLPVLVLALGIGVSSKLAIVFVEAVITIVVNTMAGIRETDPRLVTAARAFGASQWSIFGKVLLPGALPTIVAGLRLGAGRGVIAVIVGEIYAGSGGIGQLVSAYGQSFDTGPLLFIALVVAIFGYVVGLLLKALQSAVTS